MVQTRLFTRLKGSSKQTTNCGGANGGFGGGKSSAPGGPFTGGGFTYGHQKIDCNNPSWQSFLDAHPDIHDKATAARDIARVGQDCEWTMGLTGTIIGCYLAHVGDRYGGIFGPAGKNRLVFGGSVAAAGGTAAWIKECQIVEHKWEDYADACFKN